MCMVRATFRRHRRTRRVRDVTTPGVGDVYLFPSPATPAAEVVTLALAGQGGPSGHAFEFTCEGKETPLG